LSNLCTPKIVAFIVNTSYINVFEYGEVFILRLFCLFDCYGEATGPDTCFSHQLRLSMEHHESVNINTSSHTEACILFDIRLK